MSKSCSKKHVDKKQKFYCKLCDYSTCKSSSWKKHILTKKHQKAMEYSSMKQKECVCKICDKIFYSRTTLWRHKKKCEKINNGNKKTQLLEQCFTPENNEFTKNNKMRNFQDNTETQISELKSLMKNLIETQQKLQENVKDYMDKPSIVNNNNNCNNTMTINMYLNTECKGAMNLQDFMDNVKISWDDLDYTKTNGYVNGISNIFFKQLKDLKPTERPIHCSDTENMQFYFKDANKWEEDTQNKKMDESIKIITRKQMVRIKEWEDSHPTYADDPQLLEEWHQMILCLMGGKNKDEIEINKKEIKKIIGDSVHIKDLK